MEEGTPPRLAELHAELRGMTYGQLREKAELVSGDDEALDGAEQEQEVSAVAVGTHRTWLHRNISDKSLIPYCKSVLL